MISEVDVGEFTLFVDLRGVYLVHFALVGIELWAAGSEILGVELEVLVFAVVQHSFGAKVIALELGIADWLGLVLVVGDLIRP